MPYIGPASPDALEEFLAKRKAQNIEIKKLPQHYWVSRFGLAFNVATLPMNPGKKKSGKKRYKYMGFTFDDKFPKKLSTGRILYEEKKLPKKPKNCQSTSNSNVNRNASARKGAVTVSRS